MKSKKSFYIILFGIITTLIIIGFGYGYNQYSHLIKADVRSPHQVKEIKIEPGDSIFVIGDKLKNEDLITSNWRFYWELFKNGDWGLLQPGTYIISTDKTINDIIEIFKSGVSEEQKIVIKEGSSIEDIDNDLVETGLISEGDFIELDQPKLYSKKYQFISNNQDSLEGFLFPDTYYVSTDDFQPDQLIEKMLETFKGKVFSQFKDEKLPKKIRNFNELIILSSIVEKEASYFMDKRLVAGVFINRLEKGMLLQACSTVNYLLDDPKDILSLEDTSIESDYNTYKYSGLPPTPIANPSLNSIKASLNPSNTDFLYFLSDSEGKIYYARNSAEHQLNKDKYLR